VNEMTTLMWIPLPFSCFRRTGGTHGHVAHQSFCENFPRNSIPPLPSLLDQQRTILLQTYIFCDGTIPLETKESNAVVGKNTYEKKKINDIMKTRTHKIDTVKERKMVNIYY
jgi:hypothetical protein